MKTIFTLFIFTFSVAFLSAQTVYDFENFGLEPGENIVNEMTGEGFRIGSLSLPNEYNSTYDSWSGWAISADTDTVARGFNNQFSAMAGSGFDGSVNYAVSYAFGGNYISIVDETGVDEAILSGMYVTNNAFAYYSMLEGDSFTKKFGGATGEDPDFFSVVFKKYQNGQLSTDSVEYYLADFRAADAAEDYILKDWAWVDLSSLGSMDSLFIVMRSSDIGAFGINTPLYFCVDDITVQETSVSSTEIKALEADIYPSLVDENLTISLLTDTRAEVRLVSLHGKTVFTQSFFGRQGEINLTALAPGMYIVNVTQGGRAMSTKIVKK